MNSIENTYFQPSKYRLNYNHWAKLPPTTNKSQKKNGRPYQSNPGDGFNFHNLRLREYTIYIFSSNYIKFYYGSQSSFGSSVKLGDERSPKVA